MEALALVAKASSRHSLFKGVTLYKPTSKWRAQISHGGRTVTLGDYSTEEEAARVFDRACICKYGKDAVCNFPVEDYKDEWEELLNTTIPALLVKFKEERQRNKVHRTAAASRSASMPPGLPVPPSATESAPQPLPRPRQPAKVVPAANRQLPPQPHQGPPPQPHPCLSAKGTALATVTSVPFGFGYALDGGCAGAAATAKHGTQGPTGHLNERIRKRVDEFRSRGALPVAAAIADAAPPNGIPVGHCQHDPRHQAFTCQHRLTVSSGERKLDHREPGSAGSADFAMATNAPAPASPAGARRRAATRPTGASTDGAAAASPLVVLPRASSSPNLDNMAPALWKARPHPITASAPDWSTPEAAAAAEAALTEEMMAAWDSAAVATRREDVATPSVQRPLPLPPLSRGHSNSRYPASWSRSEDHRPAEIWEGAIAAEPTRVATARRRVVHVIPASRRPPASEEFRAGIKCGKSTIGDEPAYKIDPAARISSDRMETQGSSPVAGTRRLAVKRPSEEADAEVLEAEEVDGGFDVAAPAGLSPAPMAHAGRVIDRGYAALVDLGDPTYAAAMTRGAFRRTRPTEWQAVKRMRPAAAAEAAIAPMRAGEETLGTTTTTALAATEEDCDRPSSRGGGEDTYGPARRWHGPITPSAAAAWYAAIAAGASGAAAAAALPRGTFWGPIWPQRLAEQEPYVPAVGRGPPSARQSCNASAGPFVTAPAAAAAAALAEAEDLSVEELHHVLLSALQRREQQLIKQQLQEQQSIRWQQQEALVRLVEATGLRPVLAPDAAAFLDELSVTAGDNKRMAWQSSGAAGVIQSRKRAAGVSVGVNDKLYEDAIPAAQMRATRQLVALPLPAPPPQQRKSSGGGAVATAPPCSLPGSAVTPDSPTSSSSGGGGGTRDVRFLADAPTPATAPQPVAAAETTAAPANKSHHLSPTLPRRTYTDSDVNLGTDCAADAKGGCSGRSSDDTADRSDTHPSALDGKAAKDAAPAAATTSSGADTAATGPVTRPSQKWRLPGFPPYHVRERELDRAPTVRVSFGRDGQYDGYAGTSTAGIDDEHSIEVPLLLRVPSSMQQQILGMLQLQLADASQQSQPQLVRTQSQGTHEEGRDVPKAPRIELVSEE